VDDLKEERANLVNNSRSVDALGAPQVTFSGKLLPKTTRSGHRTLPYRYRDGSNVPIYRVLPTPAQHREREDYLVPGHPRGHWDHPRYRHGQYVWQLHTWV